MNRLDRALGILLHLRSGERCPASELAARFEVSPRTIYRDLDLLSALGVPVYAERGRGGGIRLMPGYFLPPVTFSTEEAVSLVLAVTLLRVLKGRPFAEELETAKRKLLAAVPPNLRTTMAEADRLVAFEPLPADVFSAERPASEPEDSAAREERIGETVTVFLRALLERTTVRMGYRSPRRPAPSERHLQPLSLLWDRDRWYLVGAEVGASTTPRQWRADRVLRISPGESLSGDQADFDVRTLLGRVWLDEAMADWEREAPVCLRLTPEQAARLRRDWYYGRARFEPRPDGSVLMTYGEDDRSLVFALLRWLGPGAELIEPAAWREALRTELAEMLADHADQERP
jgi:predicted DNA-binding transcriptional regulator YafY